jgi:phospholipase/carboxylesterase
VSAFSQPLSTRALLAAWATLVLAGCAEGTPSSRSDAGAMRSTGHSDGRLTARPATDVRGAPRTGTFEIGIVDERDSLLHVPKAYDPHRPAPFALTLHGAGSYSANGMRRLLPFADETGMILLAPSSRGQSWDVLYGGFGRDVANVDAALAYVFERYAIDRARIAIQGFSDGASYALSLGLTNGDLFTHVIALSPGFMAPGKAAGRPPVFMAHGTDDPVLPIDRTSRTIVPRLESSGYDVTYREFEGGHVAPASIVRAAVEWFVQERPRP